jgi:hypothetical protein
MLHPCYWTVKSLHEGSDSFSEGVVAQVVAQWLLFVAFPSLAGLHNWRKQPKTELEVGLEPTTCGLRNRCSTTELLQRQKMLHNIHIRSSTFNLRTSLFRTFSPVLNSYFLILISESPAPSSSSDQRSHPVFLSTGVPSPTPVPGSAALLTTIPLQALLHADSRCED